MYTENAELLHTQTNAEKENTHKQASSELIKRREIQNSAFVEVTLENGEKHLTLGKYRINKEPITNESETWLQEHIYEVILNTAIIAILSQK